MTLKGFTKLLNKSSLAITLIALSLAQAAFAQDGQKRVYRWVDEDGNVHYTQSLPPNYEGETHDELSHDGIVRDSDVSRLPPPPPPGEETETDPANEVEELPRDKSGLPRRGLNLTRAEKQDRMDRMLLLRFKSEDELLEARDVEINQLAYDKRLLSATHESLRTSLRSSIILAGHRQRAGIEVQPETLEQISRIRSQLEENESSLEGLKIREDNVRAEFEEQLNRYRELVELYSEEDI